MYDYWITLVLKNFSLAMLTLAIIFSIIEWVVQKIRRRAHAAEIFFHWIVLLALGFTAMYAFFMHAFFPNISAASIGWQNSPFQFEVAMANLGFGLMAIAAFSASYGFRLATVLGNLCWLWGDAAGHVYQMIDKNNYAIGNAGSWLWMDILIPLLLLVLIRKLNPSSRLPEIDQYQGPQNKIRPETQYPTN